MQHMIESVFAIDKHIFRLRHAIKLKLNILSSIHFRGLCKMSLFWIRSQLEQLHLACYTKTDVAIWNTFNAGTD